MADTEVAVLGAGPYGLGCAALLGRAGVDVVVFGEPMSFWRRHMPVGMLLRSSYGCEIGEQRGSLTLAAFARATAQTVRRPLPVETFVDYGLWYQQTAVPTLDARLVSSVSRSTRGFAMTLADGDTLSARRVIVAAGIDRFAAMPDVLAHLPHELATHSCEHGPLDRFVGKRIAVIGAGQSALEFAALLSEQSAEVELIVRGDRTRFLRGKSLRELSGPLRSLVYPPEDVGPPGINLLTARPNVLRRLPRDLQIMIGRRATRPAGAEWLTARVNGVPTSLRLEVESADQTGDGRVRLRLSDGSERTADHVIAATGFRVDIGKYPFLADDLLGQITVADGYPVLASAFESSVAGLHFIGAPAAWSYGPLMRFVSGSWFASRTLARLIAKR